MFIKENISAEDDLLLWNSFLTGNDEAYSRIYEQYVRHLFTQGLQFTSDRELIKDCIHDVFVKLYQNRDNLSATNNVKLYLFIALKNTIINALKKRKVYFDPLDENMDNEYISDNNTGEYELINKESETLIQKQIKHILNILTVRQREVVHYRFVEEMSFDEISMLMDMNYQSVQNLLQRSIKKIKEYFKKVEK